MKKKSRRADVLMIAASEQDANLFYATKFLAPDPVIYAEIRGRKYLLMSDLEVDRARSQARVDQVCSLSALAMDYKKRHGRRPDYLGLISDFLKRHKVSALEVPGNFPLEYADPLRRRGFKIQSRPAPFYPERTVKSPAEVRAIEQAIRKVEKAFGAAVRALRQSVIKKGKLYHQGRLLTSEGLRKVINVRLMEDGCLPAHTIVACGKHAVDPHDEGSGPLYADQTIIMDIFPRDEQSRYFADFTRTVVRGRASAEIKKMYRAVKEGQDIAFKKIRAGVDASEIHQDIMERFEALGFPTGIKNGRMQGFFHGTGHGLGLDIHEFPRVGGVSEILEAGHVVTVEPGLYYEGLGGIRLEDVVVVTKTGCRNLTRFPKVLEIR